jgi:hypothetical protein
MQKVSNENLVRALIGAGVGGGVGLGLYRLLSKDPSLLGSILATTGGAGIGTGISFLPKYLSYLEQQQKDLLQLRESIAKSLAARERGINNSQPTNTPSPLALSTTTPEGASISTLDPLQQEKYPGPGYLRATTFINPTYGDLTGIPVTPNVPLTPAFDYKMPPINLNDPNLFLQANRPRGYLP